MASTMKDIARVTGLSLATISKHLNGGKVLEENRIKIDNAIKELDFHVNEFARSLKTNRSKTIGLLLSDHQSFFCTAIVRACEECLEDKGYTFLLSDSQLDPKVEKDNFFKLVGRRVDGIIALPVDADSMESYCTQSSDIPVVFISEEDKEYKTDTVHMTGYAPVYKVTSELIKNGHKKIAVITTARENKESSRLLRAYKDALRDNNLEFRSEYVSYGQHLVMLTGYNGIKSLLSMPDPPTAIISFFSELTLGAYIALTELQVKMPDDLSFAGVDLLSLNLISSIELSRITIPYLEIAQSALNILFENIESKKECELRHSVEVECVLCSGKSTGAAPKNH